MMFGETLTFWLAVVSYAGSFLASVVGMIFRKEKSISASWYLAAGGFSFHTIALTLRWFETGYPPFVAFFESVSASCWFAILGFLVLTSWRASLRGTAAGVMPVVFLLMGWASTPSYAGEALSASLQSTWLFIHASFATAGVGAFIVAAGISMVWLWRKGRNGGVETPDARVIDETVFRFISVGFLFYTIMIISGAIWANQAWGRYWGWDPIETWSLITWLLYALYLHMHFTYTRLRGSFLAWYAALAVVFAAFSLWGVGFVYQTIHTYG